MEDYRLKACIVGHSYMRRLKDALIDETRRDDVEREAPKLLHVD